MTQNKQVIEHDGTLFEMEPDENALAIARNLMTQRASIMTEKERHSDIVKTLNRTLESVDQALISAMSSLGMFDLKFPDIGSAKLKENDYPSYNKTVKPAIFARLRELGEGDLIDEVIPDATFKKWWREQVDMIEADVINARAEANLSEDKYETSTRVEASNLMISKFNGMVKMFRKKEIKFRRA